MFRTWYVPFYYYGVIHGDPHLGNYTVAPDRTVNLLDFGCIRVFRASFVRGVIDLYHALQRGDRDLAVHAYESWGFGNLSNEIIDVLNRWALFVYGPLLEDRERLIQEKASGVYGAAVAESVHRDIRRLGGVQAAARIRLHGPRRDRARLGVSAPQGRDQLVPAVPRADRRFRRGRARGPATGRIGSGRGARSAGGKRRRSPSGDPVLHRLRDRAQSGAPTKGRTRHATISRPCASSGSPRRVHPFYPDQGRFQHERGKAYRQHSARISRFQQLRPAGQRRDRRPDLRHALFSEHGEIAPRDARASSSPGAGAASPTRSGSTIWPNISAPDPGPPAVFRIRGSGSVVGCSRGSPFRENSGNVENRFGHGRGRICRQPRLQGAGARRLPAGRL